MKDIGKILKKNADFTGLWYSLMKKTQGFLLEGSDKLILTEFLLILSSNIITISRICQLTRFQKLIMKKSIEF